MRARSSNPRSPAPLVITFGLIGVFCTGLGLGQLLGLPLPGSSPAADLAGPTRSAPAQVSIPALDVRAGVVAVGRAADGSIATPGGDPARSAGWYALSAPPGDAGTAVIVGHVDTADRPAVFSGLSRLRHGDLIEVRRADHRLVRFLVTSVERFPKTAFPVRRIFASASQSRLVLVTCGGAWIGGSVGYADNIIVFATQA
ncbi:MAG TPA: sortase [Micromonosporaceae bacterium]